MAINTVLRDRTKERYCTQGAMDGHSKKNKVMTFSSQILKQHLKPYVNHDDIIKWQKSKFHDCISYGVLFHSTSWLGTTVCLCLCRNSRARACLEQQHVAQYRPSRSVTDGHDASQYKPSFKSWLCHILAWIQLLLSNMIFVSLIPMTPESHHLHQDQWLHNPAWQSHPSLFKTLQFFTFSGSHLAHFRLLTSQSNVLLTRRGINANQHGNRCPQGTVRPILVIFGTTHKVLAV